MRGRIRTNGHAGYWEEFSNAAIRVDVTIGELVGRPCDYVIINYYYRRSFSHI